MELGEVIRRWNMKITGVVHVGANLGQEATAYSLNGIDNVWWIEGNPDIIPELTANVKRFGHQVICALITDRDNTEVVFNITNYKSMSSSIFEFGTHKKFSPDTVFVNRKVLTSRTLDSVCAEYGITGCNFLNMDLQGAELLALRGADHLLDGIDYVMTEINDDEVYLGCAKVRDLDKRLAGFKRVETSMVPGQGWGDALYVRLPR